MCMGPELLIPMALAGGGTVLSKMADSKSERAINRVLEEQTRKNKAIQDKNIAATLAATENYGNVNDDIEANQAQLDDRLKDVEAPGMDDDFTATAPDIVGKYNAGRVVDALEKGKARSKAYNRMLSVGDTFFDNALSTRATGTNIGMNNNLIQGNDRVTPFKVNAASHAGDSLNTIADLFKTAAMASNLHFATGGGLPGAKPTLPGIGAPNMTPTAINKQYGSIA